MLPLLFLFLSFFQVGFFSLGSDAGAQALLEHEAITLHHWLTPSQLADLMTFCRVLPGGTAVNTASLCGTWPMITRLGLWGGVGDGALALTGLVLPSFLWTSLVERFRKSQSHKDLVECVLTLLRPLVPGLIVGAALIMCQTDIFGSATATPWELGVSVFLFLATLVGVGVCRFNGGFMIVLCGLAGWLLL